MPTPDSRIIKLREEAAGIGVLGDTETFQFQSWFDSSLLQNAVVIQPPGSLMLYPKDSQYPGRSLSNSPNSQVPIAVTARNGGKGGGSIATFLLAPGQSIAPFDETKFKSFTWGMPYGWMGGGLAQLLVSQSYEPGAVSARPEILFHRSRFAIQQPAGITSGAYNNSPLNWPIRFPWVQAFNSSNIAQAGSPSLAPEPTRIVMVLRGLSTLLTPASMIAVIQGADDFCLDAGGVAGAITQTNPISDSFTWPSFVSIGTSGNLATQNVSLDVGPEHPLVRLGCSSIQSSPSASPTAVGVTFIDNSGVGLLANCYVDVVRYGRL